MKELSKQVREFVAIENATVLPLSAHTGHGLDDLRTSLAAALGRRPPPHERPLPGVGTVEHSKPEALEPESPSPLEVSKSEGGTPAALPGSETDLCETASGVGADEIAIMEAPEGAATATVLDYTSSAKTGKLLVRTGQPRLRYRRRCRYRVFMLLVLQVFSLSLNFVARSRRKLGGLWHQYYWWCPGTAARVHTCVFPWQVVSKACEKENIDHSVAERGSGSFLNKTSVRIIGLAVPGT